jgi:ferredoxin
MAIKIDTSLCISCNLCVMACPDVFEMGDDGYSHVKPGADENLPCVDEAISQCPTGAITKE